MKKTKYTRWLRLGLGTIAALFLVGCRVEENLTLALRPNYLGPVCLDLGHFRGSLDVQVVNGDLQEQFQIAERGQAERHALELGPVSAARPLAVSMQGDLASGQLDAIIHYGSCEQYANASWRVYGVDYSSPDRVGMFRFLAAVIGGINLLVLVTQFRHLQTILSAAEYDLTELAGVLAKSPQRLYVKVRGQVTVAKPLRSPWKHVACVYYSKRVTQKYKQSGKKGTVSKVLENHSRRIPFQLRSGSTQADVHPYGAVISACTTYRDSKLGSPGTIETQESVLPCARTVLVMGMATIQRGQLQLQKPAYPLKQTRFQIYREDAQALEGNIRLAIRLSFVMMVTCSLFWLPLVVPDMADPAQFLQEVTQDW
ncbi:MAG: hypothetical protein F6J87_19435 [Spirulina sp. SIO3F2]|nr:hypothetical protein [Spirulina sp. SIO3F2]